MVVMVVRMIMHMRIDLATRVLNNTGEMFKLDR